MNRLLIFAFTVACLPLGVAAQTEHEQIETIDASQILDRHEWVDGQIFRLKCAFRGKIEQKSPDIFETFLYAKDPGAGNVGGFATGGVQVEFPKEGLKALERVLDMTGTFSKAPKDTYFYVKAVAHPGESSTFMAIGNKVSKGMQGRTDYTW